MKLYFYPSLALLLVFAGACSSFRGSGKNPEDVQLLSFAPEKKIGLVVGGIDWKKSAAQDNPGVDCTLKLERQGPPESIFSCVVREKGVPYIVRVYEAFKGADKRTLQKITIDSKSKLVLDRWLSELKKSGFTAKGGGDKDKRWEFGSSDGASHATVFWSKKSTAVSLVLRPK
jgi:hypothetical protein